MKKNVLITSFGSNTSIGIAKCLMNDCNIYGIDSNPYFECNGFEFAIKIFQVSNAKNKNYISDVIQVVEENNIDCIIPVHDYELNILSQNQHLINTKIAVNSTKTIDLCNNKINVNKFLNKYILVPKVYEKTENIFFPVIVKDIDGVSSKDINVVYSMEELNLIDTSNKIIQEYISDGIEYTVDCYSSYLDSNIFYSSIRLRKEVKAGMSVKSEIVIKPALDDLCKLIHQKLNYVGVSNIQFIEKNNKYYFIEINPRFAGAGILTYLSGYNFPLATINELCNGSLAEDMKLSIGNKMVRYYNETFFDERNNYIRLR